MKTKYRVNKINELEFWYFEASKLLTVITLLFFTLSCNDEACDYDERAIVEDPIPVGCTPENELNLSTGIDVDGNSITPEFGVVDPYWRVLNEFSISDIESNPCTSPVATSFSGDGFVMNFVDDGQYDSINQDGASTIAPLDFGTNANYLFEGCTIPFYTNTLPYIFERSFCVTSNTTVDFSFSFKAYRSVFFQLIDNATNTVLSSSNTYNITVSSGPATTWNFSNLPLSTGSYSVRANLVTFKNSALGFNFLGSLTTTNGDNALSNNLEGCCDNNVISILNILEETECNNTFNYISDAIGDNWAFNLLDSTNTIISTQTTDTNGNIFFSGLADGSYTIEIVNQTGWTQTITSQTVTVANNSVEMLEFFSCPE